MISAFVVTPAVNSFLPKFASKSVLWHKSAVHSRRIQVVSTLSPPSKEASNTNSNQDDSEARLQRLQEDLDRATRLAVSLQHKKDLRRELLDRVADAMSLAIGSEIVDRTEDALRVASEAKAVTDELSISLTRNRTSNAKKVAQLNSSLREAKVTEKNLQQRVHYLENVVAYKTKELEVAKREGLASLEEQQALPETRRPATALEAQSLFSSLLLYRDLSSDIRAVDSRNRKEEIPFHVALSNFLNIAVECENSKGATMESKVLRAYAMLWRSISSPGRNGWRGEILHAMLTLGDESLFSMASTSPEVRKALQHDLRVFQALHSSQPMDILAWVADLISAEKGQLPPLLSLYGDLAEKKNNGPSKAISLAERFESADDWSHEALAIDLIKFVTEEESFASSIADRFYGLRWDHQASTLQGILSREEVHSAEPFVFVGVEEIRERLCTNSEFLLNGLTAQNVLLYGGPGTGKSTMCRQLLKDYGDQGLRLVEVAKEDMVCLPDIMECLSSLPHKFVVFIDDLTFEQYESEAMRKGKAALEGSLRVASPNVVVYATSNRRYPVGSKYTDSTEEKLAFSYRFGITLSFPKTSRQAYINIVDRLARDAEIEVDQDTLHKTALQWALGQDGNSNGLSGRTARQFVDFLASEQALHGANPNRNWMISDGNKGASAVPANIEWMTD